MTLNLDLSGSFSSSVSPWDHPRAAFNYGSTFTLCGVQVDETTPCVHSARFGQWNSEDGDKPVWRSLRSCWCPLLFQSSNDSRSLLCQACQVLWHTVRSLASRRKACAEAGVSKDERKVNDRYCADISAKLSQQRREDYAKEHLQEIGQASFDMNPEDNADLNDVF